MRIKLNAEIKDYMMIIDSADGLNKQEGNRLVSKCMHARNERMVNKQSKQ
jgi:hypothetical protein